MIKAFSTISYGCETQANGKRKLYIKRGEADWDEIASEHRREFQNAVNELAESDPEEDNLMDVWQTLDYDLPETPWDWMEQDRED